MYQNLHPTHYLLSFVMTLYELNQGTGGSGKSRRAYKKSCRFVMREKPADQFFFFFTG
jgi:hypothetical protein